MAHDEIIDQVLEVRRSEFAQAELHDLPDAELADGQIRLRIERFAVTANNISYAGAGDLLGYWDFFPADDDPQTWGRVPAMGWAEIIESRQPDLAVGGRYYGWFPMATTVTFTAGATDEGFRDDGPHRLAHAPIYRAYVASDRDPYHDASPDGEDRHAVLRVLFLTGFLADEFFADGPAGAAGSAGDGRDPYFGAQQVIVLSASSKTAIGFAQRASKRPGLTVVGLTSEANAEFVRSLGFFDSVVTYDRIDDLDDLDSVVIDMAGNPNVIAAVHHRLGDRVRYSMMIGRSHHDAVPSPDAPPMIGPAAQFFFAPADVERRIAQWGQDEYRRRTAAATEEFVAGSRSWMTIDRRFGPDGVVSAWGDVLSGALAPNIGVVTSFG